MSDDVPKPDFSLVTTEQLIDEIIARHDAVLIVRAVRRTDTRSRTLLDYSGGRTHAIGLAEHARHELLHEELKPDDSE